VLVDQVPADQAEEVLVLELIQADVVHLVVDPLRQVIQVEPAVAAAPAAVEAVAEE
jgi:hypothetical protein